MKQRSLASGNSGVARGGGGATAAIGTGGNRVTIAWRAGSR